MDPTIQGVEEVIAQGLRTLQAAGNADPYHLGLSLYATFALHQDWDIRTQFRKGGELTLYKLRVLHGPQAESLPLRKARLLVQGLINLEEWSQVLWTEHTVDPESGEVLIDEWMIPTQWRSLQNPAHYLNLSGSGELGYYTVISTPSGCRCNCDYALNAPKPTEDTPWGPQEIGSTAPCAHSELVIFMRTYGLATYLRERHAP